MKKILQLFFTILFSFFFHYSQAIDPNTVFIHLAKKVQPSVVNISTQKKQGKSYLKLGPGLYIPHQTPQMMGSGSGFIISKDGLIVTNAHVVKGSDKIQVQFENDTKLYPAKILGADRSSDIALLKVNVKKSLKPIEFGDSQKLQVGEWVAAIGNPHGYGHTMTKGIISAIKREIDDLNLFPLLQTDASINPGNSGGPLVNLKGEVVGVNNAIAAGANGISFAIPINNVKTVLEDLKNYGYVRRGFIGIQFRQDYKGAVITGVVRNSPADQAGLKIGDTIIKFNSNSIKKSRDLPKAVDKTPVGKKSKITVLRNGRKKTFTITPKILSKNSFSSINPQSPIAGKGGHISKVGFKVSKPSSKLLNQFNLPNLGATYLIVTHVQKNSLADRAGLQVGDSISQVNGQTITSIRQLKLKLKKGHHLIQVLRYHRGYNQYLAFIIKIRL